MNAESAAFVPSASRGRKPASDNSSNTHTLSPDVAASSSSNTPSSKIPRSTSANINSLATGGDANKFSHQSSTGQSSSSTSNHSRSSSLPGNGASTRGRGASASSRKPFPQQFVESLK